MTRGSPDWQPWTAIQRFSETGGAIPYEQKVTVPAGTADGSFTPEDMQLEKGFISRVWIRFPQGPAGLLHIRILDESGTPQIFPGGTGNFSGDNEIIEFDCEIDVPQRTADSNYYVQLDGYNEDDAYEHAALVRVWVVALP